MDKEQVGTLQQLRPKLRSALSALDDRILDDVIRGIVPELTPAPAPLQEAHYKQIDPSLTETNTYYAIHDSDFDLLSEGATVATAFCAGLPNAVSLLSGLVVFLFKYRKKRIRISGEQALLLKTLRRAPGVCFSH